ncbi:Fur family transcriptional regulator [Parabacteroides pacaensis]|uniref:Fur family transcriptional regulator n=1 Tax=Parabacteroides pacaensis TaxID=2086575 RepID=UPI000D105998|nr:Fur family transcriptional regulator [Parabacteroides pacaensis]
METTREIKDRLLQFGVKPSLQRIAIMNYLLTHSTHPTADTIFNDLYPSIPTLSKTTVYNTLKLLAEQGAILSLNIDEKNVRYDGDISNHAHFRCKRCGNVFDLKIQGEVKIPTEGLEKFSITECQIYYKGYCNSCEKLLESTKN